MSADKYFDGITNRTHERRKEQLTPFFEGDQAWCDMVHNERIADARHLYRAFDTGNWYVGQIDGTLVRILPAVTPPPPTGDPDDVFGYDPDDGWVPLHIGRKNKMPVLGDLGAFTRNQATNNYELIGLTAADIDAAYAAATGEPFPTFNEVNAIANVIVEAQRVPILLYNIPGFPNSVEWYGTAYGAAGGFRTFRVDNVFAELRTGEIPHVNANIYNGNSTLFDVLATLSTEIGRSPMLGDSFYVYDNHLLDDPDVVDHWLMTIVNLTDNRVVRGISTDGLRRCRATDNSPIFVFENVIGDSNLFVGPKSVMPYLDALPNRNFAAAGDFTYTAGLTGADISAAYTALTGLVPALTAAHAIIDVDIDGGHANVHVYKDTESIEDVWRGVARGPNRVTEFRFDDAGATAVELRNATETLIGVGNSNPYLDNEIITLTGTTTDELTGTTTGADIWAAYHAKTGTTGNNFEAQAIVAGVYGITPFYFTVFALINNNIWYGGASVGGDVFSIVIDAGGTIVKRVTRIEEFTSSPVADEPLRADGSGGINFGGTIFLEGDQAIGRANTDSWYFAEGAGNTSTGNSEIGIGKNAAFGSAGVGNVFIGQQAGENNAGSIVTGIGFGAAMNNTGVAVTAIGTSAGNGNTFGNVILLGAYTQATKDNQLIVGADSGPIDYVTQVGKPAAVQEYIAETSGVGASFTLVGDTTFDWEVSNHASRSGRYTIGLHEGNTKNDVFVIGATGDATIAGAFGFNGVDDSLRQLNDSLFIGENVMGNDPSFSVGIGKNAAPSATGAYNVAVGRSALAGVTSGSHNFGLGFNTGLTLSTGWGNILIGSTADTDTGAAFGRIAIGYNATATKNSQMMIGGTDGAVSATNFISEVAMYANASSTWQSLTNTSTDHGIENGRLTFDWYDNTHASRVGRFVARINDSAGEQPFMLLHSGGTVLGVGTYAADLSEDQNGLSAFGHYAGQNVTASDNLTALGYYTGQTSNGSNNTFVGAYAGRNGSGGNAVAVGMFASDGATSVVNSTVIGVQANQNSTKTTAHVFGYQAGFSNTGDVLSAFGYRAGFQNAGIFVTAFGYRTAENNAATSLTAVGHQAFLNGVGNNAVAVGQQALENTTNGANSVALGYQAAQTNTGQQVTTVGYQAGTTNIGDYLTAVGASAGFENSGASAVAFGYLAGYQNTAGNALSIGHAAGYTNAGEFAVMIGRDTGNGNTGNYSTAVGGQSAQTNGGAYLAALGYRAGRYNTGANGTFVGAEAGIDNGGADNTMIGYQSGISGVGLVNVAFIGSRSGYASASVNAVFIGREAGRQTTGPNGVGIGYRALYQATATSSTAIGFEAGNGNTGTNSTFIGREAGKNNTFSRVMCIGMNTVADMDDQAVIGSGNQGATELKVTGTSQGQAYRALTRTSTLDIVDTGRMVFDWFDNTHASRVGQVTISANDWNGSNRMLMLRANQEYQFGGSSSNANRLRMFARSSTTNNMSVGEIRTQWVNTVHASRTSETIFYNSDYNGSKQYMRAQAVGIEARLSFFGATPVAQQPGGAQTAGATYGATEQDMLQKVYDAVRNFGLMA